MQRDSVQSMARISRLTTLATLFAAIVPLVAFAQSDEGLSLGELARVARSKRVAAAAPIIDNDNLTQVMQQGELPHAPGALEFGIEPSGKNFQIISPDATCSLSFNANATPLLVVPVAPTELPAADVAKLEGPATISDDTLQISVYNGSEWNLREITIGLTIVRAEPDSYDNLVKLLPATREAPIAAEKRPDTTVLLHLRGTAAPLATAVFTAKLGNILGPDQDWHWAIVQAKGIPTNPRPVPEDFSGGQ